MSQQATIKRSYDHRLRQLVQSSGDVEPAIKLGVPRSTARGWLRCPGREVVTCDLAIASPEDIREELLAVRRQNARFRATLGLLVALLKAVRPEKFIRASGGKIWHDSTSESDACGRR